MFERLLAWTETIWQPVISLPAFPLGYGAKLTNNWDILDPNSASDADILIAYNLLEAGRLWGNRRYLIMGTLLLQRIAQEEVMDIPGLGQMLLPGKIGFNDEDTWRLNPSYLPPQLLARFSSIDGPWEAMVEVNQRMWLETAPNGFRWTGWSGRKVKAGSPIP